MNTEVLSTVFTGLVGLITAFAGFSLSKNKKLERSHKDLLVEFDALRREVRVLRRLDLLKTRHIAAVEGAKLRGVDPPEYPNDIIVLERVLEKLERLQNMVEETEGDDLSKSL